MASSPAKSTAARRTLLRIALDLETDFLLARQRAKQIAALLGFELQDQTRIATAVSEIARNAWEYAHGGAVEFFLDPASSIPPHESRHSGPQLRIVISDRGHGIPHLDQIWAGEYQSQTGMGLGLIGARRLLDEVDIVTGATGTQVTLVKLLPRSAPPLPNLSDIAAALARTTLTDKSAATSALASQNHELITLLNELRAREAELRALNVELEETNRGVLVLYAELADKAQAVQQASEMKTRFLSGVTHELRTPLNSIVSLARLMLGHTDGPLNAEQDKQVNFILRSAQNLTEMVNDLLDLAKIEAGKSTVTNSAFTVQTLFAGLRGMFRPLATNPAVKLIFETPEEPIDLFTDEGKLSQILRNFISNALKFTEQGTVTVKAQIIDDLAGSAAGSIRFSVEDTGAGIAPEHHALVMQEWGQAPTAGKSGRAKGSGLGLPLSRSLAELLGGTIGFTSAPGQGSCFHVTLPALAQPASGPDGQDESQQPQHILIVDDDEVARYLLRRQLGTLTSAPIEEAPNGADAIEAIAAHPPRLLFLDLVMPGMNGHEVAKLLRARPETAQLPIVLHTSKLLTPEELRVFESLDLLVVAKRPGNPNTLETDDLSVELERALLEVGLSNLHQGTAR
jgi:signal transduction histidine kinase/CheY-like chemotaxis protein